MSRLYFDYNATTPIPTELQNKLAEIIKFDHKNPSSTHADGRKAKALLEEARHSIATYLGCVASEIIFTSGATESNNLLIQSVWEHRDPHRDKIICSSVEHDAVREPLEYLQKHKGATVQEIEVDQKGQINLDQLRDCLDEETLLVSVMMANNETGMIFPIHEISQMAHEMGALMHSDAACAIGKMPLNFNDLSLDFCSFSGHKVYGPKGLGVLLIKKASSLAPLLLGGAQEQGKRAGTENIWGIFGLREGLDFAFHNFEEELLRQKKLRDHFLSALKEFDSGIKIHQSETAQLANTINLFIPGVRGQTLLARLDLEGVSASFGSACHSGSLEVSRILLALDYDLEECASSIRLSFGKLTTEEEIKNLIQIFKRVLPELR